jgi:hypothetical protein
MHFSSECKPVVVLFEHSNSPLVSGKGNKLLDWLSDSYFLQKNLTLWGEWVGFPEYKWDIQLMVLSGDLVQEYGGRNKRLGTIT